MKQTLLFTLLISFLASLAMAQDKPAYEQRDLPVTTTIGEAEDCAKTIVSLIESGATAQVAA
jgi:hypothetical protein